jgi:hypothetical protein
MQQNANENLKSKIIQTININNSENKKQNWLWKAIKLVFTNIDKVLLWIGIITVVWVFGWKGLIMVIKKEEYLPNKQLENLAPPTIKPTNLPEVKTDKAIN